jgi:hypothetical protein
MCISILLVLGLLLPVYSVRAGDPTSPPIQQDFVAEDGTEDDEEFEPVKKQRFQWGTALGQSGLFLLLQHSVRLTEGKTRDQLGGPFFRDYFRSVTSIQGWSDGNRDFTNYATHPGQGAVAGFIQVHNDPRYRTVEFGEPGYWKSRWVRALGYATLHSFLFEWGPASEASIGNVGLKQGTSAWGDHVITPIGGVGVMMIEDSIDKYVLRAIERRTNSRALLGLSRCFLNPTRTLANMMRIKRPWYRDRYRSPGPWQD